jgi:hypothetical protein
MIAIAFPCNCKPHYSSQSYGTNWIIFALVDKIQAEFAVFESNADIRNNSSLCQSQGHGVPGYTTPSGLLTCNT